MLELDLLTIADLLYTLQKLMGWSDLDLNCVVIPGKEYGVYYDGVLRFAEQAVRGLMSQARPWTVRTLSVRTRLCDLWEHDGMSTALNSSPILNWMEGVRFDERKPIVSVAVKINGPGCVLMLRHPLSFPTSSSFSFLSKMGRG